MAARRDSKPGLTIWLCTLAALFEGVDIASMGLAAPHIAREFALTPGQIGWALSASLIGMIFGSTIGGRVADRFGRKIVLVCALLALGVFSLMTIYFRDFSTIMLVRLLVGVALGGAFPIVIALSAENSLAGNRGRTISRVHAGHPSGAAIVAVIWGSAGGALNWRGIFVIGGVGPLMLAFLIAFALPESPAYRAARMQQVRPARIGVVHTLFGEARLKLTLLIWASCLCTLFAVYILLNWVPSLVVAKGLSLRQSSISAALMHCGAAIGTLAFGAASDKLDLRLVLTAAYLGLVGALLGFAFLNGAPIMFLFSGLGGLFVMGCQIVLYTVAASAYPTLARGTGVGATVAVGRVGAVCGPILAGTLLGRGMGVTGVVCTMVPGVIIAAIFSLILSGLLSRREGHAIPVPAH